MLAKLSSEFLPVLDFQITSHFQSGIDALGNGDMQANIFTSEGALLKVKVNES